MAQKSPSTDKRGTLPVDDSAEPSSHRESYRWPTLYDAVAGKLGTGGFLSTEQVRSSTYLPSGPEDYLLRRTNIPSDLLEKSYATVAEIVTSGKLPDSEMLKAVHTYASDFYFSANGKGKSKIDMRSLDETALIAVGILLEEAVRETLGENGDMAFVEPEGLENGLGESKMTKHQIKGRVKSTTVLSPVQYEDSLVKDASPAKRLKR
ncbi:hypothetical protein LTR84_000378 [Exophiala bonariae]|uniref:Uncharacterized protein n=1 Tax=Exophiala bonariae TaxID=1690606 RepID=A0AAV9NUE1_9EURO|nr:hypothetical protein LTR84_000378 [Exophiala bonariae]